MTTSIVILAALLLLLAVVLATPFVVELDTRAATVELRWGWIGSFRMMLDDGPWRYRARTVFVSWTGSLGNAWPGGRSTSGTPGPTRTSADRERREERRTSRAPARRRWLLRAAWNALRAGRVRHFRLRLDTGDVVLNAWLFPLLHLWRLSGADVGIRFTGGSEWSLTLSHTPIRALWAVLRTT